MKKAVKRLKNGKPCGEDKIVNENDQSFLGESHERVNQNI